MIFKLKRAFNLAETLTTMVILGIIAVIVIPNLINRQVEDANRTKVKKAMAAYEKAINFIILENDIKSTEELKAFGEEENCKFSKTYFKTVQDGTNNCIFKTADKVWWDITDLTNPIIILKDSQLNKSSAELQTLAKNVNDKTVFALVGRFDDLGTLRVNDNAYEQGLDNNFTNQKYVGKLWYFITQSTSVLTGFQKCQAEGATTCTITANGISTTYTKVTTTEDTNINYPCLYNRETKAQECDEYTSTAKAGDYWITNNLGRVKAGDAKSEQACENSVYSLCSSNGDYYEAAKIKCEESGGHLANLAELKIAYNNGLTNNSENWVWASEEKAANNSYCMTKDGKLYTCYKNFNDRQLICIGE